MNDLEIELDDIDHRYTLGGIEVPGCTRVLSAMGAITDFRFLADDERAYYQSRGHSGHRAVELLIRGELDRRTLPGIIKGYLKSWEIGVEEYGVEPIMVDGEPFVEKILAHSVFRYGVRPDLAARVRRVPSVVELKLTSAHNDATALQTASQLLAARQKIPELRDRYAFRLIPNEKPEVKKYSDPTDEGVWLSMLNSYNWLSKHKRLRKDHNGNGNHSRG